MLYLMMVIEMELVNWHFIIISFDVIKSVREIVYWNGMIGYL